MRLYTAHVRRRGGQTDLILVKEDFSWPAFFFTALWALWHRLWLATLALVALQAALNWALTALGADPVSAAAVMLGIAVAFGYLAGDLRRSKLERKGYRMLGVVSGRDRDSAARRFLDETPLLAAELAP